MARTIFEWLWRIAIVAALGWIGWGLQQLHEDLRPQADDQTTASAEDQMLGGLDDLRDEVAELTQKVNAVLVVLSRSR